MNETLATALREAGAPAKMVEDAEAGRFNPLVSPSTQPMRDLVELCKWYGLAGFAERVFAGEFDPTPEEMAEYLARRVALADVAAEDDVTEVVPRG